MKTLKPLFLLMIVFACMAACDNNEEPAEPVFTKFGEIISLKIGESVEIDGPDLVVAFDSVIEDSRCAIGVECFWEGQAVVNLLINKTQSVEVIMRAGHEELAKDTLDDIAYTLVDVTPYPDSKETLPIPAYAYLVDIQVDKL